MKTVVVLAIAAVVAALLPGQWLELQRGSADPWRIVTCHFTHWNYEQLAWDVVAFLALGVATARRNRSALPTTLLASILLVPFAVLAWAPELDAYRGLSGIASALFALLATTEFKRNRIVMICAILFAAKLVFEAATGGAVFVRDLGPGVVAVPIAHLAGAIIGLVAALCHKPVAVLQTVNRARGTLVYLDQ